jgi:hypothetical protein
MAIKAKSYVRKYGTFSLSLIFTDHVCMLLTLKISGKYELLKQGS